MPLGINERPHVVGIEVKISVIRRNNVRGGKRQEMEKSLFVHLCMQRNSPIILPITIPIPAGKKFGDVVHLFDVLGRVRELIAKLAFEFLLVCGVGQYILAIVQNLGIRIEQHSVELPLPGVQPLYGRQELIRIPERISGILEKGRDLGDKGFAASKKVSVKPGRSLISVILTGAGFEIGKNLLVKRIDRYFGNIYVPAGLLFP